LAKYVVILFCLALRPCYGAPITSNATGNWSSTGSWIGGLVPGTGDTATITNTHVVTVDDTRVVDGLVVSDNRSAEIIFNSGADLTVNGNVELSNTPNSDATWTQNAGDVVINGDLLLGQANSANVTFNVLGGTLTVNGTLNVGVGFNPQNSAIVINNGSIVADDIVVGTGSAIRGHGTITVNNDYTLDTGAIHQFTIESGPSPVTTTVGMDLYLGDSASDVWTLEIADGGGVREIGASDSLDIFSFGDQLFQAGIELTGTGTIFNVTITFDGSVDAGEQDQFANATVEYDVGAGTVYITNLAAYVPLPNGATMGIVVLGAVLLLRRPRRLTMSVTCSDG
jgi:hypothetical protein